MSEAADARLCLFCGGSISLMRAARSKFCSKDCGQKYRKQEKDGGKELALKYKEREARAQGRMEMLVHSCLANPLDPFVPANCRCHFWLSYDDAEMLIKSGDAVDFASRRSIWCQHPILLTGVVKKAPRSATIERPHIERMLDEPEVVLFECEDIESERMDFYQFLTVQALNIRQVPADEYDRMEQQDPWRGRAILVTFKDERSSVGSDLPRARDRELDRETLETEEKQSDDVIERGDQTVSLEDVNPVEEENEKALVGDE